MLASEEGFSGAYQKFPVAPRTCKATQGLLATSSCRTPCWYCIEEVVQYLLSLMPVLFQAVDVLAHRSSSCKIIGPTSRVEQSLRNWKILGVRVWVELRSELSS
jgi:hypothetical protein